MTGNGTVEVILILLGIFGTVYGLWERSKKIEQGDKQLGQAAMRDVMEAYNNTKSLMSEQNEILRNQNRELKNDRDEMRREMKDVRKELQDVRLEFAEFITKMSRAGMCIRALDCENYDNGMKRRGSNGENHGT